MDLQSAYNAIQESKLSLKASSNEMHLCFLFPKTAFLALEFEFQRKKTKKKKEGNSILYTDRANVIFVVFTSQNIQNVWVT